MANNVSTPSENDSVGDNFTELPTLFGNSNDVDGFNKNNKPFFQSSLSSLTSTLNTHVELDVLSHSANEQMPREKKRRGRPRGSKNKPKPNILRERNEFPRHIDFTVPAGMDIVNAIIEFGRNQDATILVHSASGFISEVNLFNRCSPSNDLSFRGNLYMLSLSGFYTNLPPQNISDSSFTIQFSRGCGLQLFGGLVRHKLIASKPVKVMATIVKKLQNHNRLLSLNAIPNNTPNHHYFSTPPSINVHPFPYPYRSNPTK